MGHAIHFLERLERLSMPQADFALALYRDSELVRFVLRRVKLPDGADRVALAVERRPDTPYIIVARDGGFVTCLGKGMGVGHTLVVSRERIDELTADRAELRDAVEHMRASGNVEQLFRRLYRSGRNLSREDFLVLRDLFPLYWPALTRNASALAQSLQQFRERYRRGQYRRKSAAALEVLTAYWQATWALGHLLALFGSMLQEHADVLLPMLLAPDLADFHLSWLGTRTMSVPMMVRGAWAVSRAGHDLLPRSRRMFEDEANTFLSVLDSAMSLTAIALRHPELRAEVREILARKRNPFFAPDARYRDAQIARHLVPLFERVLDQEETHRKLHRWIGADMFLEGLAHLPPEHEARRLGRDGVDDAIAYNMPLQIDAPVFRNTRAQLLLAASLPWVVSVDIDELYLPAKIQARIGPPCHPDDVLDQLDDFTEYTLQSVPVRREATPGRNQPCSCGSGKKYKRCCGAGQASP
jgi:hypothetical protein